MAKKLVDFLTELKTTYKEKAPILVAVSKTVDSSTIKKAYDAGHRIFGENRVQVLVEKAEELKDLDISWHFIGRLQRNKIRKIIHIVSMIHSVDSLKLATAISRIALEENLPPIPVLLEVNTSDEESKAGFTKGLLNEHIEEISKLKGIKTKGFMTMAPFTDNETIIRDTFASLQKISQHYFSENLAGAEISMGMTNDYPIAIEEGATIIRVGSKIFK